MEYNNLYQIKITKHAKKQESVTFNEEKFHSVESKPEITKIILLTDENLKIAVIKLFM